MDGPDKLRLLERAVTASTNSVTITDPNLPDDPLVYVNPAFEETTGYAAEEALGRNCRFLQDEDRDQPAIAELRMAVREGRQRTVILRNYRKDGTLFWNELSIYPVRDEGGRVANFVGVQNDVTGRIRAEEVLAEGRWAERRRIARDLHGLRSAIYDLRHEGERPLVKSAESLVELNRQLMPGSKVMLTVEEGFPEDLPQKVGVELLRVVQEALTNARRHSRAGRVEVRLRGEGKSIMAEVEDDGRGFERRSVRPGVGLSAMHERAAGLGGELEITSQPGKGTRVVLRVPVGDDNPTPPRL